MSPRPTCTICDTAVGAMLPALGAVIAASIFIASIVATVCPARTTQPSAALTVTTPTKGAATWPRLSRSAFSATGTDLALA